jgi:hypothetical protein
MMTFARLLLYLFGGGLLGFGILFLFSPTALTTLVEVALPTPSATMEVRGVYGGLFSGVALFLIFCAWREASLRMGLIALAFISGGLSVGRAVGLAVDGPAVPFIHALFASEVVTFLLAVVALRRLNGRKAA